MTKDEALKLALEALEEASELIGPAWAWRDEKGRPAITAIKEALAESEKEPVAWMYPDDYECMTTSETFCTVYSVEVGSATRGESTVALYTTPPRRKPLNDEEIEDLYFDKFSMGELKAFARAIERAHGIKE